MERSARWWFTIKGDLTYAKTYLRVFCERYALYHCVCTDTRDADHPRLRGVIITRSKRPLPVLLKYFPKIEFDAARAIPYCTPRYIQDLERMFDDFDEHGDRPLEGFHLCPAGDLGAPFSEK